MIILVYKRWEISSPVDFSDCYLLKRTLLSTASFFSETARRQTLFIWILGCGNSKVALSCHCLSPLLLGNDVPQSQQNFSVSKIDSHITFVQAPSQQTWTGNNAWLARFYNLFGRRNSAFPRPQCQMGLWMQSTTTLLLLLILIIL
jgi:hypothetical protein